MSDTRASLKDSQALVDFQQALEFFSGSVERALDAVSDYLNDVHAEMERHVELLKQAVLEAKDNVERARTEKDNAYTEWQQAIDSKAMAEQDLQDAIDEEEEMEDVYDDMDVDSYDFDFDDF